MQFLPVIDRAYNLISVEQAFLRQYCTSLSPLDYLPILTYSMKIAALKRLLSETIKIGRPLCDPVDEGGSWLRFRPSEFPFVAAELLTIFAFPIL